MSDPTLASGPAAAVIGPYRHEKTLFTLIASLSVLFWVLLTLGTLGIIWIYMIFIYLFVLMAHSALISHLKGNAVRITPRQFPELHARIEACCQKVGLERLPESYLMTGDGMLNAFATRFLRRYYVVLLSDIVDALEDDQEGINFYIGHELGHIARQHVANQWWMGPAMFLPLLGSAYRRAQEYTCDQYGAACCASLASASRAMAVLAAGTQRWKHMDSQAFIEQSAGTGGFWMSLNELTSEYPWLCKRMARLHDPKASTPRRHPLAWFFAMFLPNAGPGGLVFSMLIWMFMIGMVAAIALPTYFEYTQRMASAPAFAYAETLRSASQRHYESTEELVSSPAELGLGPAPEGVKEVLMDADNGQIILSLEGNEKIIQMPYVDDDDQIGWNCSTTLAAAIIPKGSSCESVADEKDEEARKGEALGKLFGL